MYFVANMIIINHHNTNHIASWFSFFRACYVPWHYNAIADEIASLARFSEYDFWIGECPSYIKELVSLDIASE